MNGKPWSWSEDVQIRRLASSGATRAEAASAMGRSYGSICGYINGHDISMRVQEIAFNATPSVDWESMRWQRLCHCYGPERAKLIVSGRDPKTQADLARWNALGRRSAA